MKDNFDNSFDEKMFSDAWEKKKKPGTRHGAPITVIRVFRIIELSAAPCKTNGREGHRRVQMLLWKFEKKKNAWKIQNIGNDLVILYVFE